MNYSPGSWEIGQVNAILLKVISVLGIGVFQSCEKYPQMTQPQAQVLDGFSPGPGLTAYSDHQGDVKKFQSQIKNKARVLFLSVGFPLIS